VDDFDYLPEYEWPAGTTPYESYPDSGMAPPPGRHRSADQPYYESPRMNDVPQRPLPYEQRASGGPRQGPGNGRGYAPWPSGPMSAYQPPAGGPVRGYPSANGYPPRYQPYGAYRPDISGPLPAYQPDTSGPLPSYQPDTSGPLPAYQPEMSGPMRAYRPDASGPIRTYQPDSGPIPAYQPPRDGPARGYPRISTGLLSEHPAISEPIPTYQPPPDWAPPERARLDGKQILGWLPFGNRLVLLPRDPVAGGEELREHRDVSDGWLRPAVFGAMDGLVTNVSLIAGVGAGAGAGGGATGMIVLTGIAGLVAGAFSMATGEYISVSSQNELNLAEAELERKQHARDPQGKLRRLAHLFVEKGVSPNLAEAVVRQISAEPERAVSEHLRQELGIDPDDLPSPRTAALASLASFTVGALIPLSPFLLGYPVLKVALVVSAAAAFIGGAAVAKLTGRSMFMGGMRQLVAAALGAGAAFFIGPAISVHVS
jgi:vacuolar iron transporter family protein